MSQFKIKIDSTFEAENIDDAFFKLSQYFEYLYLDTDDPQVFDSGEVIIEKVDI